MRCTRMVLAFLGAVTLAASLSAHVYGAESLRTVSLEGAKESRNEVADLRVQIAELRTQLKSKLSDGFEVSEVCTCGSITGGETASGCGCGCQGNACCCCSHRAQSQGVVGGAELSFLKPHNSAGTGLNVRGVSLAAGAAGVALGAAATLNLAVDPDYQEASRVWVGWQRVDGLGVRARYWQFDHTFDEGFNVLGVLAGDVFHNWDTYTLDLEIFDSTRIGYWNMTWSLGFRYMEYEEERGLTAAVPIVGTAVAVSQRKNFTAIGLTGSNEVRTQLTSNIGFFASARASMLMGDEDDVLNVGVAGVLVASVQETQKNDVKFIFETQVGAEYTLPLAGGGYCFARGGVEMQYWDNFGVSPTGLLFDESAGFGGLFASVGVQR